MNAQAQIAGGALHLDHCGMVVGDLAAGAKQLATLGFSLQPRSEHQVPGPDGKVVLAGTANQCAMLCRGYLEIVSVTDASAESFSRLEIERYHAQFEGLHLLAIGTPNADAISQALTDRRLDYVARDLRRQVGMNDGNAEAAFKLVTVPDQRSPHDTFFFIQHRTPQLVWTESSTVHANGATALSEMVLIADDLDAQRKRYEEAFGFAPDCDQQEIRFELNQCAFLILSPATAETRFGGQVQNYPTPFGAGITVEVSSLARTERCLVDGGVDFWTIGERLTVGPNAACGVYMQFVEAST